MCTMSMVGDHYQDKWHYLQPPIQLWPAPAPFPNQTIIVSPVGREEFDALKREVEDMKSLLKRAKAYDEANNEPHCEIEEKMDFLRKVAKLVGVDLDDVIGKGAAA